MQVQAEDGHIPLPERFREKFGERFELVERGETLVLVPVPDDPLSALRDDLGDVDASVGELRREALESALEDAGR